MPFTRQDIERTWAKWGTGTPLSDEKIAHMLRVLNEPVPMPPPPKFYPIEDEPIVDLSTFRYLERRPLHSPVEPL